MWSRFEAFFFTQWPSLTIAAYGLYQMLGLQYTVAHTLVPDHQMSEQLLVHLHILDMLSPPSHQQQPNLLAYVVEVPDPMIAGVQCRTHRQRLDGCLHHIHNTQVADHHILVVLVSSLFLLELFLILSGSR